MVSIIKNRPEILLSRAVVRLCRCFTMAITFSPVLLFKKNQISIAVVPYVRVFSPATINTNINSRILSRIFGAFQLPRRCGQLVKNTYCGEECYKTIRFFYLHVRPKDFVNRTYLQPIRQKNIFLKNRVSECEKLKKSILPFYNY